jgi:hypothetical protein
MEHTHGERAISHNIPRGPSVDYRVQTTTNTAGTNRSTCFPKHGRARDNKFLVTHPMADQRCLAFAIVRQAHWPWGLGPPQLDQFLHAF